MSNAAVDDSVILDHLDRQIVRAIQLSPRASFSRLGDVLGVAEQTVARRYRRLRRDGLIRVILSMNPRALGVTVWSVRVRCRPEGAASIAEALGRRDDVAWVSIHSAGWEVAFSLRAVRDADTDELLTRLLPKAAPVLDVSAAAILHQFAGGSSDDWVGWRDVLTDAQVTALLGRSDVRPHPELIEPSALTAQDQLLIETLARDGRTSYASLARVVDSTPGRVGRRIDALLDSGAAYFDVDLAEAATGRNQSTTLWLTVQPGRLTQVGEQLAGHPEVLFAAAVTGVANLTASVVTTSLEGVYDFVSTALAGMDGITGYELVPLTRRTKYAGSLIAGDRLAPPAVASRPRGRTVRAG